MKKKKNNFYEDALTIDNLKSVWKIVKRTCKNKKGVCRFLINENANLFTLYSLLKNHAYKPYAFKLFLIFEPKVRLVMSQSVPDKIVNHFITKFYLEPYLEKKLISSNVATRKGKGTKYAIYLLEKYLNTLILKQKSPIYCLKLDIKKYFYTIDHSILLSKLERDIKDEEIVSLVRIVLSEINQSYVNTIVTLFNQRYNAGIPLYEKGVGLSIGAMTSQFLAIYYLNDLDHFIKEKLRCKYYIRYMDDFLILDTNKEKLNFIWKTIEKELCALRLKVNPKTNIYNLKNGIDFLGYKYRVLHNKLFRSYTKKTYKRIEKKLINLKKYDIERFYKTYASYYGYLKKVKKYERNFTMKAKDKYLLYKEKYPKYLIFVKEGIFYKTYLDDAMILWNLFEYKMVGDCVSFGTSPYAKIVSKLNHININYVILGEEELVVKNNDEVYDLTLQLSKINYDSYQKRENLHEMVDSILNQSMQNYEEIASFLQKYLK